MATTPRLPLPVVLLVLAAAAAMAAPAMADYAHPPLDPNEDWYKPYDLITFNVATDDYDQLMTNIVNLVAIRRDNLYVTGFTDRSGQWYIFSNRPRALIPVAAVFRLGDDYPSLIGGSWNLQGVRVSKQTILEAVERIASFVPRDSADVGYVGRALAIMAVTFAEASRFHPFHDVVLRGWESGADIGDLHKLVVKWRVASCALMLYVQRGTWSGPEVQDLRTSTQGRIVTLDDALHNVKMAIWPWREKCSDTITWLR